MQAHSAAFIGNQDMPLSTAQTADCAAAPPLAPPAHDASWDAGELGCGELVLELRLRMRQLASGQVLCLTATDPGAPADIPAWCGMTRNRLLHINPASQQYFIQRP